MIVVINLDRLEYLIFHASISEVSGTSAQTYPILHLLKNNWAGERIQIEDSAEGLAEYTCLNESFGLSD